MGKVSPKASTDFLLLQQEDLDRTMLFPTSVKRTFWWWRNHANLKQGLEWSFPTLRKLTMDATRWRWGVHLSGHPAQGKWSPEESQASSNWRAFMAISRAIHHFQEQLKGCHGLHYFHGVVWWDYVNKQGGTRSTCLFKNSNQICQWAERNLLSLIAVDLKGDYNQIAYFLSRWEIAREVWELHPEVLTEITAPWGIPKFVGFRDVLCLPPSTSDSSSPKEICTRADLPNINCTILAQWNLVLSVPQSLSRPVLFLDDQHLLWHFLCWIKVNVLPV